MYADEMNVGAVRERVLDCAPLYTARGRPSQNTRSVKGEFQGLSIVLKCFDKSIVSRFGLKVIIE